MFREGRSYATRHLVLHAFPRAAGTAGEDAVHGGTDAAVDPEAAQVAGDAGAGSARPRLGVSVGRRVGGAVERNRVKRLLREAFWAVAEDLPPGHDFVLVARPEAAELARRDGEPGFESELRELVERAGRRSSGTASE